MSNVGSENASLAREIAAAGKAAGLDIDENLVAFTIGYVTAVDDKESILIKNIQAMNRNAGSVCLPILSLSARRRPRKLGVCVVNTNGFADALCTAGMTS